MPEIDKKIFFSLLHASGKKQKVRDMASFKETKEKNFNLEEG